MDTGDVKNVVLISFKDLKDSWRLVAGKYKFSEGFRLWRFFQFFKILRILRKSLSERLRIFRFYEFIQNLQKDFRRLEAFGIKNPEDFQDFKSLRIISKFFSEEFRKS